MRSGVTTAAPLIVFPVMLALGIVLIPVVPDYSEHGVAADSVRDHAVRWVWGHLIAAAAFGLGALAPWVVARTMRAARRAPAQGAALVMALGAGLHAAGLGADGIGPVALLWNGADPQGFFDGGMAMVPPVFLAGSVLFGVGQIVLLVQCRRDGLVPRRTGSWLIGAAVTFSIAEAVPTGWGLYGVALVTLCIYLVLHRHVRHRLETSPAQA